MCPRCAGFLCQEWGVDAYLPESVPIWYCLNCGGRFEEQLLLNCANPPKQPNVPYLKKHKLHTFPIQVKGRPHA